MRLSRAGGVLAAVVLVLTCGFPAMAQATSAGAQQVSEQDRTFMRQNAQGNLAEISAGQLAMERATSQQVRQVAQTIVQDHQRVLGQLRDLAQRKSVNLPDAPDEMQQRVAQELQGASGSEFDRLYLQNQISGHQLSIQQTQQEISSGSDPDVVELARAYLPVAQHHLQLVQQLSGGIPGQVNAGSGGAAAPWASDSLILGLIGGGALLVALATALLIAPRRRA